MAKMSCFLGVEGKCMPPTKDHRPALWEAMLGTVFAMNDVGEVEAFDYDYDAAVRFSGALEKDRDVRIARRRQSTRFCLPKEKETLDYAYQLPRWRGKGQIVLWVK